MDSAAHAETTETSNVHPFERAGLGRAPFRFVGMVAQDLCYGEAILNRAEYERTGISITTKPGGSCAYCGTYIVNMFQIQSADGNRFHVGCDCVAKTGDVKLLKATNAARLARAAKLRAAAATASDARLVAMLADPSIRAQLAARPHPTAAMAARGETLLSWADWMAAKAGASGRARVVKAIKFAR